MRVPLSAAAALAFTVLAFGSLSGSPSDDDPSSRASGELIDETPGRFTVADDSIDADDQTEEGDEHGAIGRPHEALGEPHPEHAEWLEDSHLDDCPEDTERHGSEGDIPGTPYFSIPTLSPHKSLDLVDATDRELERSRPIDTDASMRWCQNLEGRAHGPAVMARNFGRHRVYVVFDEGVLDGPVQGWSFSVPEDSESPHATKPVQKELTGYFRRGEPHDSWTTTCVPTAESGWCPTSSALVGSFDRGRRRGQWTWREDDDRHSTEVRVPYVRGQAEGNAVVRTRKPSRTCESRGEVDEQGRQGVWVENCTVGTKREPAREARYQDGERLD